MTTEELIAVLAENPGKQVVILMEKSIAPVKSVETDCFTEERPWVVLIEPDLDVDKDWEP